MKEENLLTDNQVAIESMINEFRIWNKEWDLFEKDRKSNPHPKDSIDFAVQLDKLYKVKKR